MSVIHIQMTHSQYIFQSLNGMNCYQISKPKPFIQVLYEEIKVSHFGESTPLINRHSSLVAFSVLQTQHGFGLAVGKKTEGVHYSSA